MDPIKTAVYKALARTALNVLHSANNQVGSKGARLNVPENIAIRIYSAIESLEYILRESNWDGD